MMKKKASYFIAVVLCVILAGCEALATLAHGEKPPEPIHVKSVTLTKKNTYTTIPGEGEALIAVVTPPDADNQDLEWESKDTSIVEVLDGAIIGRGVGTTFVSVITKDGKKRDSCTVTVSKDPKDVIGISVKPDTTLPINGIEIVTPTITPDDATDQRVKWGSSDPTVATVINGIITTITDGTATITVTTEDGSKTATITVTVSSTAVPVTGVSLNKTSTNMTVGGTEVLRADVMPSNANNHDVTWGSSDPAVARVMQTGLVMAIGAGNAAITATTAQGGYSATCNVSVRAASGGNVAVTGLSLNKTSIILNVGEPETLIETVAPANATNKNVIWNSNNQNVVRVSQSGVITTMAAGNANITVTTAEGNFTATCAVTVRAAPGADQTPVASDYTITGLNQIYDGSPRGVSIVPKTGFSPGLITIFYSSSTYVTSATPPWVIGSYTVTFNVAAAPGWLAANGLSAGTLTIIDQSGIPVTGVSLNKSSATLSVGNTETLLATVSPSDASNKSVTWNSSVPSVASVTQGGLVTAHSAGSSTIIVTTVDGGRTANCTVTVSVDQTPVASDYVITGLTGVYDGLPYDVGITAKEGKSPGAITIFYNGSATPPTAIGAYPITFNVAAAPGWLAASGLSGGTLYITAAVVEVTGVTLNKTATTIVAGGNETLIATVAPSNATNQAVRWDSSNHSVATVSLDGKVSAGAVGTATITATTDDGGKTANCVVTVVSATADVTFISATADGSSSQTSTQLTLNFSVPITGL
jgi:uncharacterized protein YjdB